MEWLLSSEDIKYWMAHIELRQPSVNIVRELKEYLVENNLYIGPATFTSGLIIVLHGACQVDCFEIVQYLLDNHKGQFDVNQLIPHYPFHSYLPYHINFSDQAISCKDTLVHAAIVSRSTKLLRLLVSYGASVNIPDLCSVTPLLKAADIPSRNKHIVGYLIRCGADIHYQDIDGKSVLMYAVSTKQVDKGTISLLLKSGVDPTLTDTNGYTVLHHAVLNGREDTLNTLFSLEIPPSLCPQTCKMHAIFVADAKNFWADRDHVYITEPHIKHEVITEVITKHPLCPPHLKVDSMLLNATFELYWDIFMDKDASHVGSIKACHDQFRKALSFRDQLKLPPPNLCEPIEAYGGLTEVTHIQEFEEKYSDLANTSTQVCLAYQCLIVRERCLGFGNNALICFLFVFGQWMISIQQYSQGLSLWLRATEMLLLRFQEGCKSDQAARELNHFVGFGFDCCVDIKELPLSKIPQYLYNSRLVPIWRNFIECQRLNLELHANIKHKHHYCGPSQFTWKVLINLLEHLYENPVQGVDVSSLCCELLKKCPRFPIGTSSYSTLLRLAVSKDGISCGFLSLFLESGGHIFVNEVGCDGVRPLQVAQTEEITSLLLEYGAHLDAACKPAHNHFINPHLINYFSAPLPLSCQTARYISSELIHYQLLDLPHHIIEFIALHDPSSIVLPHVDRAPDIYKLIYW